MHPHSSLLPLLHDCSQRCSNCAQASGNGIAREDFSNGAGPLLDTPGHGVRVRVCIYMPCSSSAVNTCIQAHQYVHLVLQKLDWNMASTTMELLDGILGSFVAMLEWPAP